MYIYLMKHSYLSLQGTIHKKCIFIHFLFRYMLIFLFYILPIFPLCFGSEKGSFAQMNNNETESRASGICTRKIKVMRRNHTQVVSLSITIPE
jgi:hypothetical protein